MKMLIYKIKNLLKSHHLLEKYSREFYYFLLKIKRILILSTKTNKKIFKEYYKNNSWGCKESFSGPGSTKKNTYKVREIIKKVMEKYSINSIADIPCGDFNWMRLVDFKNVEYTGYDIVSEIINNNINKYSQNSINFVELDIIKDIPKKSDLIFCRDALVHLSNKDVKKAIKNFKKSNSKFLLTTTFPNEKKNKWIRTGMWRSINLTQPPFNLPQPIELYNESKLVKNKVLNKYLGLWELSKLK